MVHHPTLGIDPTYSRTWVNTVKSDTGQTGWTVAVDNTLWPTCYIGVSEILWYALACSSPCSSRADCILPARRGVARIYSDCRCRGSRNSCTSCESVSCVSRITGTLSNVIGNMTGGIVTTDPGTWVNTVLVDTGEVPGTLGVNDTLWLTLNVRVASVVPDTAAAG